MITPTFTEIGSDEGYDIQKIIPVSGFDGELTESIQIIEPDGNVSDQIYWCNEDVGDDGAGWYLEGEWSDRKIKPGEGLLVYCENVGYSLQFAGEVSFNQQQVIASESGFATAGNPCPVAKSVQCFIPVSGFEGELTESIQILDSDGNVSDQIYWCNEDVGDDGEGVCFILVRWLRRTEPNGTNTNLLSRFNIVLERVAYDDGIIKM